TCDMSRGRSCCIRKPKPEGRNPAMRDEARNPNRLASWNVAPSEFGLLSGFGIRPSDFLSTLQRGQRSLDVVAFAVQVGEALPVLLQHVRRNFLCEVRVGQLLFDLGGL